jgi:hypothetical protein
MQTQPRKLTHATSITALAILACIVAAGFAQPTHEQDDKPTQRAPQDAREHNAQPDQAERERRTRIDDPALLRRRIEAAIERGEQMLERQRAALTQLDAGESPAEVMRSLRTRRDSDTDQPRDPRNGPESGQPSDDMHRGPPPVPGDRDEPNDGSEPDAGTLRDIMREHFPELAAQLEAIAQGNPEASDRLFLRMAPRIREIALDMRHDPTLGQLRVNEVRAGMRVGDATRLVRAARGSDDPQAAEDAARLLRDAIGAQFDARVALRQHEVERLVGRIGELNDEILNEIANRETMIDAVFDSIMNRRWPRPGRQP